MGSTIMSEDTMSKKLTVPEVADMFNRHPETVRRWIRNGILPAYKAGKKGQFVIYEEDVLKALRYDPDAAEERQQHEK